LKGTACCALICFRFVSLLPVCNYRFQYKNKNNNNNNKPLHSSIITCQSTIAVVATMAFVRRIIQSVVQASNVQPPLPSSIVLTHVLQHAQQPTYISFYMPYRVVNNDLFGRSYLRWAVRISEPPPPHASTPMTFSNTSSTTATLLPNGGELLPNSEIDRASTSNPEQYVYYDVYRTGCFPMIKFFCNKTLHSNSSSAADAAKFEDRLLRLIKIVNIGIPTLLYGIASMFLIRSCTCVSIAPNNQHVQVFFLYDQQPDTPQQQQL
jgi:hypothetical protein